MELAPSGGTFREVAGDAVKIVLVSVVRDFAMYEKCVKANPFTAGCELCAIDNRERNEGIPRGYNAFLNARSVDEEAWYVFCHEDFELKEPLNLASADPESLWGPIGAATKVVCGVYHQWRLLGEVEECRKDGSCLRTVGSAVPLGTPVETFDCQCFIVHSSLVRRHHLRFDEALTFDLYVEEFGMAAHEKAGIASRILPMKACHWSGGSVQPRYFEQEAHVNAKYPKACYTGTSSWILGGRPPLGRRLTVALKRLMRRR